MADIRTSKILKRLPEYLRKVSASAPAANEYLEALSDPNTINVLASLLDKINEELGGRDDFNNWSDFDTYLPEFKLAEIFEDAAGFYDVKYPELLKGFFSFKGTRIDLQYLLKVIGYEFTIYDAASFALSTSLYALIETKPNGFEGEYQQILDKWTRQEFDAEIERLAIWYADNQSPLLLSEQGSLLVVNQDIDIGDFLEDNGITLSPEALNHLRDLLAEYYASKELASTYGNCEIFATLRIDLDNPAFTGYRTSENQSQVRAVIGTRMSPCTYLKGTDAQLITKDFYSPQTRVQDPHILQANYEIAEEAPTVTEDLVVTSSINPAEDFPVTQPDGVQLTALREDDLYVINNESPWVIKGNDNTHWVEETLVPTRPVDPPAWAASDSTGNLADSYPPIRRGTMFVADPVDGGSVSTPVGTLTTLDLAIFDATGALSEIITPAPWTPTDNGSGAVDTSSYPPVVDGFVRVSGLAAPLSSTVGQLDNGDLVYFDFQSEPALESLA